MLIKDRLEFQKKTEPLTMTPDSSVREAAQKMAAKNYGAVVVINPDGTPAGMVTERDMLNKLLAENLDPEKTKLSEIMTQDLYVASEEDNLIQWLRVMSNERFRHLPVVDKDGKLLCMMSQGDFVSYTWPDLLKQISETTKAAIAPNYQITLIILALVLYAIIIPVLFNVFS